MSAICFVGATLVAMGLSVEGFVALWRAPTSCGADWLGIGLERRGRERSRPCAFAVSCCRSDPGREGLCRESLIALGRAPTLCGRRAELGVGSDQNLASNSRA
ncbi:hypothetical protein XHV734_2155 [Xanthomonas hortorum pv. vitians]|nr:hypothetical protein XHV734_2155 [Xanthomonas hortorum pv. vitians]